MKKSGNSFIFDNKKPSDSQEQILQTCPFAGQSEIFSGVVQPSSDDDSELLLTGIMMVSVSESSHEDYQTPPEHHSRSQNSSNDGHVPAPLDLEPKSDGVPDVEMDNDGEKNIVDLTNDSDHDDLGFTEETYVVHLDEDDEIETAAFETELIFSGSPPVDNVDKVFEQMPKRGKRKLPFTIESKHQTCHDSNEAFPRVLPRHDTNDDIDLIETAKMRGMSFPRPRWWPPQGFKQ